MMMVEEVSPPNRCTTIVYYLWKIFTCLFLHVVLVALVVSYCLFGAAMFSHLEQNNEIEVRKSIAKIRSETIDQLWYQTQNSAVLIEANWTTGAFNSVKSFEEKLVKAMRKDGWNGADEDADKNLQWTFAGALFYSIIVITTIGKFELVG